MLSTGWIRTALTLAFAGAGVAALHARVQAAECALEPGPAGRTVVQVIDGETVALDDGSELRLIGALAPRRLEGETDATLWPPERNAKEALEQLVLGKPVELAVAGRRSDRYGRLLAHAYVRNGDHRVWVQLYMLRQGHARAYSLPGSEACMPPLLAAEQEARVARAGIWAHPAYQIRSADQVRELMQARSSYQIVEGRIVEAADVRGQMFLNFGENWREDFTASARPRERRALEEAGLDLKSLQGRRVRVRGWIDRRSGPAIELHHGSQIEVLPD